MSYSALVSVLMAPPVSPLVPACPYERRTLSTVPSPRSWFYSGVQINESCAGASEASALICLGFFFPLFFSFFTCIQWDKIEAGSKESKSQFNCVPGIVSCCLHVHLHHNM